MVFTLKRATAAAKSSCFGSCQGCVNSLGLVCCCWAACVVRRYVVVRTLFERPQAADSKFKQNLHVGTNSMIVVVLRMAGNVVVAAAVLVAPINLKKKQDGHKKRRTPRTKSHFIWRKKTMS